VYNIVPQCTISHAKSMIKRKGNAIVEVLVAYERPIKKHQVSKVKEIYKMLLRMKMEHVEYKWAEKCSLEGLFNV
jgi:hypothetical protein